MATESNRASVYGSKTLQESNVIHSLPQPNPPMSLSVAQTLSQATFLGEGKDFNVGQTRAESVVNPSAPLIFDLNSDNNDVNESVNSNGGLSEFLPLLGVRSDSLLGPQVESAEAFNIMVKGRWGQAAYCNRTGLEYKWVPGSNEISRNYGASDGKERAYGKESKEGEEYAKASALLSEIKSASNENERRLINENICSNVRNVERRNLFQFSSSAYNGADLGPPSQGTLSSSLPPKYILKGLTMRSLMPRDSILEHMNSFAALFLEETVGHLKGKCMEELFIRFLTTSSSGKDFLETQIGQFSKSVQKKASTRVIAAAVQSHEFFNLRAIREDIKQPAKLLQRYQIKRRARVVFGVSNIVSMVAFPALLVLEEHQKLTGCALSGKQYGDYKYVLDYLSMYGSRYVLFNSSDVSGMDASVQANLPQFMWDFVIRVLSMLPDCLQYFAFASSDEYVEVLDERRVTSRVKCINNF